MITYLVIAAIVILLFMINNFLVIPMEVNKFMDLIEKKEFDKAMEVYKQSLENKKGIPELTYGLAQVYEHRQDWHMAIYEYDRLLKGKVYPPNTNEIIIRLKRVYANKVVKNFTGVVEDCYAILNIDPNQFDANYEMGKRLFSLKNYRAALPYLEKINDNQNQDILRLLIDISINEKKYQDALEYINKLKSSSDEKQLPQEISYKEITIFYHLRDFPSIINTKKKINTKERIPLETGVILGIASAAIGKTEEAIDYFKQHLKNFLDDKSDHILEGRYIYSQLLAEKKEYSDAYVQNRFIQQLNPDYRDTAKIGKLLFQVIDDPVLQNLFQKNNMEEVADELVNFTFPDFFFIEKRVIFNGDQISNTRWITFSINTSVDKNFYLFISFNFRPFDNNDIEQFLNIFQKELNSNLKSLNCVFLSLYEPGVEAEKMLIQTFHECVFYYENDFIEYIENRKLPAFFD